jgi:hypothetical protein
MFLKTFGANNLHLAGSYEDTVIWLTVEIGDPHNSSIVFPFGLRKLYTDPSPLRERGGTAKTHNTPPSRNFH